jgi:hypothetical protein
MSEEQNSEIVEITDSSINLDTDLDETSTAGTNKRRFPDTSFDDEQISFKKLCSDVDSSFVRYLREIFFIIIFQLFFFILGIIESDCGTNSYR